MGPDMVNSPSMFCHAYTAIERLNIVLKGIRSYGDMSNPAMAHVYGEALALRAFFYFDLIKWYGDVPARFEPISNATVHLPNADRDEIYIQILDDLATAADLLPWPGQAANYNRIDRINQAFARAFRARVALHAGGYSLRNDNGQAVIRLSTHPELSRSAMYEIARHETSVVMANEGRGFNLSPSFEQIFKENMAENVSVGRESIFELPYNPGDRGQWLSFFGARHLSPDRFAIVPVKGEAGPTPIMWHFFNDNDIRRDVSIVHYVYVAATAATARQEIQTASSTPMIRTAYFGKLRAEWGNRRMPSNDDGIKPIVMRYADVLLMFAEAENELNGPTDDAKNALRRVRQRAFPTGDPLNIAGLNQETFFHAIMDERAFEFLGEQRRKYDLNRWGKFRERLVWAQNQTRRLRDGDWAPASPRDIDFTNYPRHIFWRHLQPQDGVTRLEIFGLKRNEFPSDEAGIIPPNEDGRIDAWLQSHQGGGWNRYRGTGAGNPPPIQLEWIDSRNTSNGHPLSEYFIINAFFMPGPGDPVHGGFGEDAHAGYRHRLTLEQRSLLPIWSVPIENNRYLRNFPWWD
jgi:hypothetical protein